MVLSWDMGVIPFSHNPVNLSTGLPRSTIGTTTGSSIDPDRILTREQIDWIFDSFGVGYTTLANPTASVVLEYEDGTESAPGFVFMDIVNNQSIRIKMPYTISGGSPTGYIVFDLVRGDGYAPVSYRFIASQPQFEETYFASNNIRYGDVYSLDKLAFATVRDLNTIQTLSPSVQLRRVYVPLQTWKIGRILGGTGTTFEDGFDVTVGTFVYHTSGTWTRIVTNTTAPITIGIRDTEPALYHTKLPVTWSIDRNVLDSTTPSSVSYQDSVGIRLIHEGGLRGEDALQCDPTDDAHDTHLSVDVRIFDDGTLTTYHDHRKGYVLGLVKYNQNGSVLRFPTSYWSDSVPLTVFARPVADGATGWGSYVQVPDNVSLKVNNSFVGNMTPSAFPKFELFPLVESHYANLSTSFVVPRDEPDFSGSVITLSTPSQTFRKLGEFHVDDTTYEQTGSFPYQFNEGYTQWTGSFPDRNYEEDLQWFDRIFTDANAPNADTVVYTTEFIDGPFAILFHITADDNDSEAFVSFTSLPTTWPFNHERPSGYKLWKNSGHEIGLFGGFADFGIGVDFLHKRVHVYENWLPPHTFDLHSDHSNANGGFYVAFRRRSDGFVDRFLSLYPPTDLSAMTKLTNGVAGPTFAAPLAGIERPFVPGGVRPVFFLSTQMMQIQSNTSMVVDLTHDPEFISLTTTNPTGCYAMTGDTLRLTYRSNGPTLPLCRIMGKQLASTPVPGTSNLYYGDLVMTSAAPNSNSNTDRHVVIKFPGHRDDVSPTEYPLQVYAVMHNHQSFNRCRLMLYYNTGLISETTTIVTTNFGTDWPGTSTPIVSGNFVGGIQNPYYDIIVTGDTIDPAHDGLVHLCNVTFSNMASRVRGPDGIRLSVSQFEFSSGDPPNYTLLQSGKGMEEALYTDVREAHRIPYSIEGLGLNIYDYPVPELWDAQPRYTLTLVVPNTNGVEHTILETNSDRFYLRARFKSGAPTVIDILNQHRLLPEAIKFMYYGEGAGRLKVGASWRVIDDDLYEIALIPYRELGPGSCSITLRHDMLFGRAGRVQASSAFALVSWTIE